MTDIIYTEEFEQHWRSLPSYAEKDKLPYYKGWLAREDYIFNIDKVYVSSNQIFAAQTYSFPINKPLNKSINYFGTLFKLNSDGTVSPYLENKLNGKS